MCSRFLTSFHGILCSVVFSKQKLFLLGEQQAAITYQKSLLTYCLPGDLIKKQGNAYILTESKFSFSPSRNGQGGLHFGEQQVVDKNC